MTQTQTKIVGYIRVSTAQQAESGLSLESQASKIRAYADLFDLELVAIESDAGVSAKTLDRPALNRVLASLKAGEADGILIMKLDRLTRSVTDLGELVADYFSEKSPYSLLSVNDHIDTRTASGRLVLNVLASVSQWEREAIGERTTAALKTKRARGEFCGGRLRYGYKNQDGRIVENPDEQRVLKMARDMRAQAASYRAIASELYAAGYTNRKGNPFNPSVISNMIEAK